MASHRAYDLSHWGELPFVSCQCITYGRTDLLDEAVESFLRQDYQGRKELVILNDYPDLRLEYEHPDVRIVNLPWRMKSIGEKRNACVALCQGSVIFVWDDDDISLPHRISYSLQQMKDHRYFKAKSTWYWKSGVISPKPERNLVHPMGAWATSLFDEVGGYPHIQSGQDAALERLFESKGRTLDETPPENLYYVYRFPGTGSYHLSGWGFGKGFKESEAFVKSKGVAGVYRLNPHWKQDYVHLVGNVLRPAERALPPARPEIVPRTLTTSVPANPGNARKPRVLTLCFPTFGKANELQLDRSKTSIVLAPDEFHVCLRSLGCEVTVVSLAPPTNLPLHKSRLPLLRLQDVDLADFDFYWHMFRDPTQPEVLRILRDARLDYRGRPIINSADRLAGHEKQHYSQVLFRHGIGPEVVSPSGNTSQWAQEQWCRISPDGTMIETWSCNNNRGDYPERGPGRTVTKYIDNAEGGVRSIVRFGYAMGRGFSGYRYFSTRKAFKTGGADRTEPYTVPDHLRPQISLAMKELGCDVCHIEAIPLGDRIAIVDINPYPTADGATLTPITRALTDEILRLIRV